MKYAVINTNSYTGTIYDSISDDIQSFHKNQGEYLVPVADDFVFEYDEIGLPINLPSVTKNDAYESIMLEIDRLYADMKVKSTFDYTHTDGTTYSMYNVLEDIQGIFVALPIMTEETIVMKTAEKQVDGVNNVYLTLTKAEFQTLAGEYFSWRMSGVFGTMETVKNNLKTTYLDSGSTIEDIFATDLTSLI